MGHIHMHPTPPVTRRWHGAFDDQGERQRGCALAYSEQLTTDTTEYEEDKQVKRRACFIEFNLCRHWKP